MGMCCLCVCVYVCVCVCVCVCAGITTTTTATTTSLQRTPPRSLAAALSRPVRRSEKLFNAFATYEKKYGDRSRVEGVIGSKRRFMYEEEVGRAVNALSPSCICVCSSSLLLSRSPSRSVFVSGSTSIRPREWRLSLCRRGGSCTRKDGRCVRAHQEHHHRHHPPPPTTTRSHWDGTLCVVLTLDCYSLCLRDTF
jgi:hypothetical protein